jgi:hypothetical protein
MIDLRLSPTTTNGAGKQAPPEKTAGLTAPYQQTTAIATNRAKFALRNDPSPVYAKEDEGPIIFNQPKGFASPWLGRRAIFAVCRIVCRVWYYFSPSSPPSRPRPRKQAKTEDRMDRTAESIRC